MLLTHCLSHSLSLSLVSLSLSLKVLAVSLTLVDSLSTFLGIPLTCLLFPSLSLRLSLTHIASLTHCPSQSLFLSFVLSLLLLLPLSLSLPSLSLSLPLSFSHSMSHSLLVLPLA